MKKDVKVYTERAAGGPASCPKCKCKIGTSGVPTVAECSCRCHEPPRAWHEWTPEPAA